MKLRALYWIVGLILIMTAGFVCWQYRQEQRQTQLKLRLLDATLQLTAEQTREQAERILQEMSRAREKNQKQPNDMQLLHETEQISQRANEAVMSIVALRRAVRPTNAAPNQSIHQPLSLVVADGQASKLAAGYVAFVTPFIVEPPQRAADKWATVKALMPVVQEGAGNASSSEVRAMMSQEAAVVRANELLALQCQRLKIGCGLNIVYDTVGPFASAESNTVAVGEKYKAELFMATTYGLPVLGMAVNGKPIPVGPDKHGRVEFTVPPEAGKAPGGQAYWTGRIRTIVKGQDSTFVVKVAYTVRPH